MLGAIIFIIRSPALRYVSRASLEVPPFHGFDRFFAWECSPGLFLLYFIDVRQCIGNLLSIRQPISWTRFIGSIITGVCGLHSLRTRGKPGEGPEGDATLVRVERTTGLVTAGTGTTLAAGNCDGGGARPPDCGRRPAAPAEEGRFPGVDRTMKRSRAERVVTLLITAPLLLLLGVSCRNPAGGEAGPARIGRGSAKGMSVAQVVRLAPAGKEPYLAGLHAYHLPLWRALHEDGVLDEMRVFELTRNETSAPGIEPWHYLILARLVRGVDPRQFLAAEETARSRTPVESRCATALRTEALVSTPGSFYPVPAPQHRGRAGDVVFYVEFIGVDRTPASLAKYRDLMQRYFGPANGRLVKEGLLFDFAALETVEVLEQAGEMHPWNQLHISGDLPEHRELDWKTVYEDLFRRLFVGDLDRVYSELPERPDFSDYSGRLILDLRVD